MILQARLDFLHGRFRVVLTDTGFVGRGKPPNHTMSDAEFARLYLSGMKVVILARKAGMTRAGVSDRRRRLGLPGRPTGRPRKKVVDAKGAAG